MRGLKKILVPIDLSEHSRRGMRYACSLAADEKAGLIILHVANEFEAWELYSDEVNFVAQSARVWPTDRIMQEASLDVNRFLEEHMDQIKKVPIVSKRIALGSIPRRIAEVALDEEIDLIVMSPRRHRRLRSLFTGSITDRVTRMSPCPVLSITEPLPSPPWRGSWLPALFSWPRPKAASV